MNMQILVVGNTSHLEELRQKFGPKHIYLLEESGEEITVSIKEANVVFDFVSDNRAIRSRYLNFTNPFFFNTALITLSELLSQADISQRNSLFGFCGLPTFVNRSVLEVSMRSKKDESLLKETCSQLGTDFVCVEDRVGMVTPRVICMIINEAYYTLEEGTATRDDIDLAMKLGTNYPYGPFEWAKRIGIKQVIELLTSVYNDTKDDRYKVCALLRSEAGVL
jgi:3-hydroxybutyryl-CoA dehydrogenase